MAVVGKVGAGKTSLLHALLAEMSKTHGIVAVAALHNGKKHWPVFYCIKSILESEFRIQKALV